MYWRHGFLCESGFLLPVDCFADIWWLGLICCYHHFAFLDFDVWLSLSGTGPVRHQSCRRLAVSGRHWSCPALVLSVSHSCPALVPVRHSSFPSVIPVRRSSCPTLILSVSHSCPAAVSSMSGCLCSALVLSGTYSCPAAVSSTSGRFCPALLLSGTRPFRQSFLSGTCLADVKPSLSGIPTQLTQLMPVF